MDDARHDYEYPHHAVPATYPPLQPQPSTTTDSAASSNIPTFQLESNDSEYLETEDSEGSIDEPPSPGSRVMISPSDIEEPEEEQQEPQDLD